MACNPSFLASGDETVIWVAHNLRYDWLTETMLGITNLGSALVILLVMSAGYWSWNKSHGKTIIYGLFFSSLINLWLKSLFMECRPPQIIHEQFISDLSYSFPSGHAQVTILMWFGLAYYVRSRLLSAFFILIGLLISFSRIYLGVHYVHDVIAGILIGLIILGLCLVNEKNQYLQRLPNGIQFLLLLFVFFIGYFYLHDNTEHLMITLYGLLGVWLGSYLEEKKLQFIPTSSYLKKLRDIAIGFMGIILLWKGVNYLIVATIPLQFYYAAHALQFTFLGIWMMFGSPLLFKKLP
jgi:membrane-associated phospholipid phosphatase